MSDRKLARYDDVERELERGLAHLTRTLADLARTLDTGGGKEPRAPQPRAAALHVARSSLEGWAAGGAAPERRTARFGRGEVPREQERAAPKAPAGAAGLVGSSTSSLGEECESLCETPEVAITDAIRSLADRLERKPARIVSWVQDRIEFEPYPGALKTAGDVLRTRSGNAWDTASLVIALLRASGVKARYATGTARIEAALAASWLGTADALAAIRILNASGLEAAVVAGGGGATHIELAHAWVEAEIAYFPGGGVEPAALSAPSALRWVPVDASIKRHQVTTGRDPMSDIGADPAGLLAAVASHASTQSGVGWATGVPFAGVLLPQLAVWGEATHDHLAHNGIPVDEAYGTMTILAEEASLLPPGPPFEVVGSVTRSDELDDAERIRVTVRITDLDGDALLEDTRTSAEAFAKRWSLSWGPATTDDAELLTAIASETPFPAFLLDVTPEIRARGRHSVAGTGDRAYGWPLSLKVAVTGPGFTSEEATWTIAAGTPVTFVVAGGALGVEGLYGRLGPLEEAVAAPLSHSLDETIGEALGALVHAALQEEERLIGLVAGATETRLTRRLRVYHAAYEPDITEVLGIPYYAAPGAVTLRIDHALTAAGSLRDRPEDERTALLSAGLVTGSLGHQVLDQVFEERATGGLRAIQEANLDAVEIHTIDAASCASTATILAAGRRRVQPSRQSAAAV